MADFVDRVGIEVPVVQAGMGGGVAGPRLAAAVSEAGGLGTLGMAAPASLTRQLTAARDLTDRPLAVNLLLPFARAAHWRAASAADVVVTFWGTPRRQHGGTWIHQAGSVDEARAAHHAGADAVIVQGVEAGGHVRGVLPARDLLEQVRAVLPRDCPVLLAGGTADADDVTRALAAGADAAVAGTRFLMSEESGATAGYKQRLVDGSATVLTELFGVGWPGAHRVLPNDATRRWLRRDPRGPGVVRLLNRATRPVLSRSPDSAQAWMLRHQAVGVPFFSPTPPAGNVPDRILETSPLYAGETVARIHQIAPAASIVRHLAGLDKR
ncbi:NAD(P)H-dependent flavin oxidoreductase [Nocardioides pelophilus]|uniref:NAD(P)H-dependent flavin oxidoreductase n=1 Tax=Nocardioides pelophilus TaxID=2172019 RepID=UPI0015FF4256|nr:nitronate monooxygenase [Nocardioides pelophilus]